MSNNQAKKPITEHFCGSSCEKTRTPCDLCLAQRRKLQTDRDLEEAKPTLRTTLGAYLAEKAKK